MDSILGLIFPPYSLFSGAVKYVTDEESSGTLILLTTSLDMIFPFVGNIVGELITEEIAEYIEKNKFEQLIKKYPACVKCGQIDPQGLFNSKGERLCRACFRKLTSKITLVSSTPVRCDKCGKLTKEYFIDNGKIVCENCFMKSFIVPSSVSIIRESSFSFIQNYMTEYHYFANNNYFKKYKKSY